MANKPAAKPMAPEAKPFALPVVTAETHHNKEKATMEKTVKTAEEFVSFSQGNVEALMKAGQIWAAGVQDLNKSFAATAQAQM